jgi:DNA modification methylase
LRDKIFIPIQNLFMSNDFISSIWRFDNRDDKEGYVELHNFLRWYGKLPPQLVRRLILLYSKKGEQVLANFSGSGTIPLECMLNDRNCLGYDSNPLAVLISDVKTKPFNFNVEEFISYYKKEAAKIKISEVYSNDYEKKWFNKDSLKKLKTISRVIKKFQCKEKERNFLNLIFASIIRDSSLVDSRCINHIVLDKKKKIIDVEKVFFIKLEETAVLLNKILKHKKNNSKINITRGDARNLDELKDNSIDLIISHPPYLGNVDYTNINQLSTYFLNHEYKNIRETDVSTGSIKKYLDNMYKALDECFRVLKKNHHLCFIIGDNRQAGFVNPTFSYFIQYGLENNMKVKDIFIWILNQKAGMNVKRHGNHIDHNYIIVFEKT